MGFTMEDMPTDVAWVMGIQWSGQPIGLKTFEEVNAIIDKYPEWFPWEHKQKAIPKEVHEAYLKERYPGWGEPYIHSTEPFPGLLPPELEPPTPQLSLIDMMKNLFKEQEDKRKKQEEEDARLKALWDKHYSKYDLPYRS